MPTLFSAVVIPLSHLSFLLPLLEQALLLPTEVAFLTFSTILGVIALFVSAPTILELFLSVPFIPSVSLPFFYSPSGFGLGQLPCCTTALWSLAGVLPVVATTSYKD